MIGREALLAALRRMQVETGRLVCLGCGYEHNCSIHGCAILREAVKALEAPEPADNEPLTLDELRKMDGEPVWVVDVGPHKWYGPGWAIVDRDNCLVRTVKNWNAVFFESYGERWLAYRRPPEGEA